MTPVLLGSVVFSLYVCWDYPAIFLLLIPSLTLSWTSHPSALSFKPSVSLLFAHRLPTASGCHGTYTFVCECFRQMLWGKASCVRRTPSQVHHHSSANGVFSHHQTVRRRHRSGSEALKSLPLCFWPSSPSPAPRSWIWVGRGEQGKLKSCCE